MYSSSLGGNLVSCVSAEIRDDQFMSNQSFKNMPGNSISEYVPVINPKGKICKYLHCAMVFH